MASLIPPPAAAPAMADSFRRSIIWLSLNSRPPRASAPMTVPSCKNSVPDSAAIAVTTFLGIVLKLPFLRALFIVFGPNLPNNSLGTPLNKYAKPRFSNCPIIRPPVTAKAARFSSERPSMSFTASSVSPRPINLDMIPPVAILAAIPEPLSEILFKTNLPAVGRSFTVSDVIDL